jgi:hypothetical protein
VPSEWPGTFFAGEYSFPELFPEVPQITMYPPNNINLKEIFEYLIK